jgi:hypothetical protein
MGAVSETERLKADEWYRALRNPRYRSREKVGMLVQGVQPRGGRVRVATEGCAVCKLTPDLLYATEWHIRKGSSLDFIGWFVGRSVLALIAHREKCMEPVRKVETTPLPDPKGLDWGDEILLPEPVGWWDNANLIQRIADLPKRLRIDPASDRRINWLDYIRWADQRGPNSIPGRLVRTVSKVYTVWESPAPRSQAIAECLWWLAGTFEAYKPEAEDWPREEIQK